MRYFLCLLLIPLVLSCSSDGRDRINNPYLLNINFKIRVDLSLPQYSKLNYPSNSVYISGPNYGNKGIIVTSIGNGNYVAFDAADPNHPLKNCSRLQIQGLEGVCSCGDGNQYNLITGTPLTEGIEYPLLRYQVINNGNGTLTIIN